MIFIFSRKLPIRRSSFWRLIYLVFLGCLTLDTSIALAESLEKLEVKVLTQYEDFLPETEREVIAELQIHPHSAYAHYLMSHLYLRRYIAEPMQNTYAENAIQLAQQALDLDNTSEFGYLALSDAYQTLGFTEKAWTTLQKAPKDSWRVLFRIVKSQLEPLSPWQAVQQLEAAVGKNPESLDIMTPLLITEVKTLAPEDSLKRLEELNKKFQHPLIKQELAMQYLILNRSKEAMAMLEECLKNNTISKYPEIDLNYGVALFYFLHKDKKAIEVFSKLVEMPTVPSSLAAMAQMHISLIYLDLNDRPKFLSAMLKALEMSPQKVATLDFIITGIFEHKKGDQFEDYMAAVNDRFPGQAEFYALIGKVYAENLGQQVAAIDKFEKAVILEPLNPSYHDSIGLSYYRLDQHYKALLSFDEAVALDPNDSVALYNKACIFSLEGLQKLALRNLKQAIAINPSLQQTAVEDGDFASLKELPSFKLLTHKDETDFSFQTPNE